MAITASNNSAPRELIPAGTYVARCFKMIHVGTVQETVMGKTKTLNKVRIGWEFPTLTKVFDEAKGPQPLMFETDYTLHMGDNANLRKMLTAWRGKAFTEEEAKNFDVTKLLGVPCLINLYHKPSKADASKVYEAIGSISPLVQGMTCPPQVNPNYELSYDKWDQVKFDALPDFIKDKMKTSIEYKAMTEGDKNKFVDDKGQPLKNDMPWEQQQDSEEPPF